MSEIKIEIDLKEEKVILNKNLTWTPLRNGEIFQNYLEKKNKISLIDKKNLIEDSVELLGKCLNPKNISALELNSTGLCFGQIQSGKTTSMEAVFALAADNNYKILILLTGSVGPLVDQNTERIGNVLIDRKFRILRNVEDEWDPSHHYEILKNHLFDWNNPEVSERDKKTLVILSMKNAKRIRDLHKLFFHACDGNILKYSNIPTLIVDDECDNHSLNAKAKKNDPDLKDERKLYEIKLGDTLESICEMANLDLDELLEINPGLNSDLKNNIQSLIGQKVNIENEVTATFLAITNLRKIFKFHSFLGYTATPNANLLINTFNNLSPSFGKIISPGENYTGLDYFFENQSKIDRFVRNIEPNIEDYEVGAEERPKSLYDSYLYFLTCVTCGLYQEKDKSPHLGNMSMIVHPHGHTDKHEVYLKWLKGLQDEFRFAMSNKNSDEFKELIENIEKNLKEIKVSAKSIIPQIDEKFLRIFQSTDCLGVTPIPFNASRKAGRKRIPTVDYKRNFANILVGGQGLDRGYTVEGLTTTYLCRPLGTKQEDTLLQRARFMGYHRANEDFLRLYFSDGVLNFFEGENDRNKKLMKFLDRFLKSNKNLKTWRRYWFGRDRTEFKLTRQGIMNDINLSTRTEPYPSSVRCRYTHLLDEKELNINRKAYEILNTNFNDSFKKLDELPEIKNNHPWTVNQNIKVMINLTLREVLDQVLNKFEFETRDLDKFAPIMNMIDNYLDPIQEKNETNEDFLLRKEIRSKTLCPLFIFRSGEKNPRKPYTKSTLFEDIVASPVTSAQGESSNFVNNFHNDKTLFPGDGRIHWEFLHSISNGTYSNEMPSIQIHEINVYEKKNGEGELIKAKVPYISFFLPNAIFEQSIVGIRR
jgi:hypothetical protein